MSDKPASNPYQIVIEGTASYPDVFTPKAAKGSTKEKYSLTTLLDKKEGAKHIAKVRAIIDAIVKDKCKGKALPADKVAFKDGTAKDDVEGYTEDVMYVPASSDRRPQVVDRDGRTPLQKSDDKIYPGARVRVCVRFWYQDNEFGKRINASLEAVQFVGDGERIGAAPVNAEDVFTAVEDSDDEIG